MNNVFSDIKISDPNHFLITEELYPQILCFLTFNFSAMMGSLTTSWIQWVYFSSFLFSSDYFIVSFISAAKERILGVASSSACFVYSIVFVL